MRPAVYFDFETCGIEPHRPEIQLAAVVVDEDTWAEISSFERKIEFDLAKATSEALAMNSYNAEKWAAEAVSEARVVAEFDTFLTPFRAQRMMSKAGKPYFVARLVGHNAATFDGPRLMAMFKRHHLFLPADPRVRDTVQLALWHFDELGAAPKDFKLVTLCQHFGVQVKDAHDALADVRMTVGLARALREARRVAA